MRELRGAGVSPGVGAGPVVRLAEPAAAGDPAVPAAEGEAGVAALGEALAAVARELSELGERAGGDTEAVLRAQAQMAGDPTLRSAAEARLAAGDDAPAALRSAVDHHRAALRAAGGYLAERVADLDDVERRALARLAGATGDRVPQLTEPSVLVARDLAPADTAALDPALVAAFVTEEGSATSHTAILARGLGIPAVVACPGAADLEAGATALVDGKRGAVTVDPPAELLAQARSAGAPASAQAPAPAGPAATADGRPVPVLGNADAPAVAQALARAGAEGIGLLRTELCFLDRETAPTLDEQADAYRAVLEPFAGAPAVVRVLDAGADKPLPFLEAAAEPNPALGARGLRLLRARPHLLRDQLRAIKLAADGVGVRASVMAPMVATAEEARWFAGAARDAGWEGPVCVMVEIPAAALRARELLAEVDFLSIGTNDLAQYLFAADRQLGAVAALQSPWQPALLELVGLAARAAAEAGKPCGVCGEAAGDPLLACVLAGLGVTSLSMGAGAVAPVRAALAAATLDACARAAAAAVGCADPDGARAAAREALDSGAPAS
jgi:phosphotransferase system enzyme I (PtsI)